MVAWFRNGMSGSHAGLMTFAQAALGLWMAALVLSLISIGLFFATGALVSVLTVRDARRRVRQPSHHLGQLARWCSVRELAEMDAALDGVLASDHGTMPGRPPR